MSEWIGLSDETIESMNKRNKNKMNKPKYLFVEENIYDWYHPSNSEKKNKNENRRP